MIFRKAVLLLLALCIAINMYGQDNCHNQLNGKVVDEEGNPVVSAAIFVTPGNIVVITDEDGSFIISGLCDLRYSVRVQSLGFEDLNETIRIKPVSSQIFKLKEKRINLEEVVVQHHDDFHTEHNTNYVVLDERKLAEVAGKSLGESLLDVAGVNSIQAGPGIFKPVIHGVHSQRILILNHGIRQEGQQWGAEHAPEIDPFIASNIVVVKDASAIKYGTDALGGVIIVNPPVLPETNRLAGTIASVLQSNGRSATLSGMLEGGFKNLEGWGWRIQGTGKRTGDFHSPNYVLTNTGVRELNFSAALGYHKEKFGLDLFFSRFQSEIGILKGTAIGNIDDLLYAMERDIPLYTNDFSFSLSEPRQEVSHNLVKLNGHLKTDAGEWRFQYGFQNNNRQEFDIRRGSLSGIPSINLRLNTHSLDGEWEMHHNESNTFAVGINTTYQVNSNIFGTQRIPFIPNFRNITTGLYAVSKFVVKDFSFDVGARYDFRQNAVKGYDFKNELYSATLQFNNVSASLGISRPIDEKHRAALNISSSWRPPHVAELYSLGTHQSAAAIEYGLLLDKASNEIIDPNAISLETEQALKFVGTYRFQSENMFIEFTPYMNVISNYIFLRPEGITKNVRGVYPYFRYDQTDAVFIGADLSSEINLFRGVSVAPGMSLLKARDYSNDDYFVFVPSSKFDLDLRYERPSINRLSNFYLESGARFVTKQIFAPRIVTVRQIKEAEDQGVNLFENDPSMFDFLEAPSGYVLLNASIGFSLKQERVQYDFRFGVDNMANTAYREYTNRFRYYADDLGRNFTLSLKCIF